MSSRVATRAFNSQGNHAAALSLLLGKRLDWSRATRGDIQNTLGGDPSSHRRIRRRSRSGKAVLVRTAHLLQKASTILILWLVK